jgi:hypothetical protein
MLTSDELRLIVHECRETARALGDSPAAGLWLELADSLSEAARFLAADAEAATTVH